MIIGSLPKFLRALRRFEQIQKWLTFWGFFGSPLWSLPKKAQKRVLRNSFSVVTPYLFRCTTLHDVLSTLLHAALHSCCVVSVCARITGSSRRPRPPQNLIKIRMYILFVSFSLLPVSGPYTSVRSLLTNRARQPVVEFPEQPTSVELPRGGYLCRWSSITE